MWRKHAGWRLGDDFAKLIAGNIVTKIGGGIHEFIFIVLLLKMADGNALVIGAIYFLRLLPYFLLGPVAGLLSDTIDKIWMMQLSTIARCVTSILFAIAFAFGEASLTILAMYGMVTISCRVLYGPAFSSSIATLVQRNQLKSANSINQLAAELGLAIGPLLGAFFVANGLGYTVLIVVDGMAYGMAFIILTRIRTRKSPSQITRPNLLKLLTEHARFFSVTAWRRDTDVKSHIIVSCLCILSLGGAIGILVPTVITSSSLGETGVGIVMGMISFGALFGSLICSKVTLPVSSVSLMFGWITYGLVLMTFPVAISSVVSVVLWALMLGTVGAFVDIILPTIVQTGSSTPNIGHNFSFFSTLANLGDAASGPIVGGIALLIGTQVAISAAGLALIIFSVSGLVAIKSFGLEITAGRQ